LIKFNLHGVAATDAEYQRHENNSALCTKRAERENRQAA